MLVTVCLFTTSASANAQQEVDPTGESPIIAEEIEVEQDEGIRPAREGIWNNLSVMARGGIAVLTDGLSEETATGPSWGVVVGTEPFETLTFEVAYEGARFPRLDPEDEGDAVWRTGVSSLVKLETAWGPAEPFIGAGVGISYWNPRNDLVTELPVTAGIDLDAGSLSAGVRGSLRGLVGTGFTGESHPGERSGCLLTASLLLGGAF
jgi:hypothetical protein